MNTLVVTFIVLSLDIHVTAVSRTPFPTRAACEARLAKVTGGAHLDKDFILQSAECRREQRRRERRSRRRR